MDASNDPKTSENSIDINNSNKTFSEVHKAKITQLKRNLTSLEALLGYAQELGNSFQKKKKESKELSKKVQDLEKALKEKETDLESKNSLIKAKDLLIKEQAKMINLQINEIQKLKEEISVMKNISDAVEKDLEKKNKKISELEEYFKRLDKVNNINAYEIMNDMQEILDQSNAKIDNLKKEKESLEIRINELNKNSNQLNNKLKSELTKKDTEISRLNLIIQKLEAEISDKNINSSEDREVYSEKQPLKRKFDDSNDSQTSRKIVKTEELKKYNYKISYNRDSFSEKSKGSKCIKIKTNDLEFLRLAIQAYESFFYARITITLKKKLKIGYDNNTFSHFANVTKSGWDDRCMKDYMPIVIRTPDHFDIISQNNTMPNYSKDDFFGELRLIALDPNSKEYNERLKKLEDGLCEDFKKCSPNHKIQLFVIRSLFFNKEVGDDATEECGKLREAFLGIKNHHNAIHRHSSNFYVAI